MSSTPPLLLDTTVLVDVSRGRQPAFSWLDAALTRPRRICLSTVTIGECFAGVRPAQRGDWRFFLERLAYWEVMTEVAIQADILRYDLARRGQALSITD